MVYLCVWLVFSIRFMYCSFPGEIKLAEIKMENGRSRGCGLVQFLNPESARRAISILCKIIPDTLFILNT